MRKNWQFLFLLIFFQTNLDGFMIYFFYGFQPMFFLKDFLLGLTFLSFMLQEPFRDRLNQLGRELGIAVIFCMAGFFALGVLEVYNPNAAGLTRGLLGLKLMYMKLVKHQEFLKA